jgi:hypothetical protein
MGADADFDAAIQQIYRNVEGMLNSWERRVLGGILRAGKVVGGAIVDKTPLASLPAHAASHQNGGADEISIAGLSGLAADPQTPAAHTHDYEPSGAAAATVAAHEGESDPHTQYQKESEKGAANGYASLGADGKVPSSQLPASSGGGVTVAEVDGTPSVAATTIKFPNGTITDNGDGSATYTPASSGGATIHTSAYASPPASPAAGDLWLPSDGHHLLRYSGSAWVAWGPLVPMGVPADVSFSWTNQGTATLDTSHGSHSITAPAVAVYNHRIREITAPSTPYTITACILGFIGPSEGEGFGLCWRQSSDNKMVTLSRMYTANINKMMVSKWSNTTTFSAHYLDGNGSAMPGVSWFRLTDDGTNRITYISMDGHHWRQLHSVGRTDYLTADRVGWFTISSTVSTVVGTLVSWRQT